MRNTSTYCSRQKLPLQGVRGLPFYHPDHLGSSSFITDVNGEAYQHYEYMPYGELFVEQKGGTDQYTPYLFNGKELDDKTGLYYYGARYYDPRTSVWLSVDPLAEKYLGLSPFIYCSNNPIIYIDVDGRFLYITGLGRLDALDQLQSKVGNSIVLSVENGHVSYTVTDPNKKLRGAARSLAKIIDDKSITVHLKTRYSNKTSKNTLLVGGSFMGNTVNEDNEDNISVTARQEINPYILSLIDEITGNEGEMIMHETTEAYEGAKISQESGKSSPDASDESSVADEAHEKASSQTSVFFRKVDKNGKVISNENKNLKNKPVKAEFFVIKDGKIKVFQAIKLD